MRERGQDKNAAQLNRLHAAWNGPGASAPLVELTDGLLERQQETWPGLADAYAVLKKVRVREIRGEGWRVNLQFNPRRIASSGAQLDPESLRRRPCFLCPENLPPEQKAILYRGDYFILCNPAPIFPGHLTIAGIRHCPQAISDHMEIFLQLSADFGPRMIVFYNGPCCGASAPDHLHFQAAPAGVLPLEEEVLEAGKRAKAKVRDGAVVWRTDGLGRGILVIEGKSEAGVAAVFGVITRTLRRLSPSEGEPLLNLFGVYTGERWRVMVFPRLKHRPAAYFREGEGRLLVSPGAVEMGGVWITAAERDFLALDQELVRGIFGEVAFDDAAVEALLDAL